MQLFRYSRDAYGQRVLEGINFDLIFLFAGIAALIILSHLFYRLFIKKN
jgi:hypothetical protein